MTNGVPEWFIDMVNNSGLSGAPDANGHSHIRIEEIYKCKVKLKQAMNEPLERAKKINSIKVK